MEITKKQIQEHLDAAISRGFVMSKKTREGSYGLFWHQPATYDTRTVYTRKEVQRLTDEGFFVEEPDLGKVALGVLWELTNRK